MREKLLKIIETFGLNKQLKKFNEESYELIEAIRDCEEENRMHNFIFEEVRQDYLKHIAEEMADCYVLLNQFKEYYDIDDVELEELIEYKVNRTLERIENGYYEKEGNK